MPYYGQNPLIGERRKFNGKTYTAKGHFNNKIVAKRTADRVRATGSLARITRSGGRPLVIYTLWVRQ